MRLAKLKPIKFKKLAVIVLMALASAPSFAVQTILYKVVDGKIVAYTADVNNTKITTPATTPVVTTPVVTTPVVTTPVVTTPVVTAPVVTTPVVTTPVVTTPVVTPPVVTTPVVTTPVTTPVATSTWGTYLKPFAADSLWNSQPVNPVFDNTFSIPLSTYYPLIGTGAYSTGVFKALPTDAPMVVYGKSNANGVWDPDSATYHNVTIPHWPASTLPATGSDGHADIIDEAAGVIHSFWQLKQVNGQWTATQYAWMPLAGRGFGDLAHYFQGARAVGIPASAGLIRASEINDGAATYTHALAMSLTYNAMGPKPLYVYPATSADWDAGTANTGKIPEGSLLMLPPDYNTSTIANVALRKVADTLKKYGAYVVDRNYGTPYVIYVENGTGYDLMPGGWNNTTAAEMQRIRAGLRRVVSASSWIDGNGKATSQANSSYAAANMNTLSLRGPWTKTDGPVAGVFDSQTQRIQFPATTTTRIRMTNGSGTGMMGINWAEHVGKTHKLSISTTGGAFMRFTIYVGSSMVYDSGNMTDGMSARFTWPAAGGWTVIYTNSGLGGTSSIGADLSLVSP